MDIREIVSPEVLVLLHARAEVRASKCCELFASNDPPAGPEGLPENYPLGLEDAETALVLIRNMVFALRTLMTVAQVHANVGHAVILGLRLYVAKDEIAPSRTVN